jgi:RNA polymerase sigma-70 factor (ECF subfamily)
MSKNTPTIDELARRVLAGDAGAYSALLAALTPALKRYFTRQFRLGMQADDLVQETLMAVHSKFHTFRQAESFAPWLYAIARHKAIDYLRAARRRTTAFEVPIEHALDTPANNNDAQATENTDFLVNALGQLSERDRTLLAMAKIEGLSHQQIGMRLNLGISAVKVGIHRAMRRLTAAAATKGGGQ